MNTMLKKHVDVVGPMDKARVVSWLSNLGTLSQASTCQLKHCGISYSPIFSIFLCNISPHHTPLRPQVLSASGQVHGSSC